ncbi:hypothetical protein ACJMK2_008278 [Sinanodonta woodiana]|uniref:Uncharacterized protein n=1 Tax=Sinanodonta woodiana TaxID=1069815 RepID=A0ABD3VL30_SINWO
MCLTPQNVQSAVLFKKFNLILTVVLTICLIPVGSAGCPPGQFLHFNPATGIVVCCITRPLPVGFGFLSCIENGTLDMIEECSPGRHQPDNTTTESEATCTTEFECNQEDNVKERKCDASGRNCVNICVCNYEGGYCGKYFYDCKNFPKDCPSELVQRDCSCRRDSTPVRSLPESTSIKPGQMITTSSTTSSDRGSKPTPDNDVTSDDGAFDNTNGTTNGTGSLLDQTHRTALNIAFITIGIIMCVGVVAAAVILAYIFRRRLNKWLSKYNNICCRNRTTNPDQDSHPLESVLTLGSEVSGQGESHEEEAEPFLPGGGSGNRSGGQSEGDNNIQSLVVDNDESEHCNGAPNKSENDDGSIQAHMQSLLIDTAISGGCIGDQRNQPGDQGEVDNTQADESRLQSLVVNPAGSKGGIGDQKIPAGNQDEGNSIPAGESRIQSLVVDQGKMVSQGIETAGPFCSCCGRHQKRCNKHFKEQCLARVKPQPGVIGTRQTSQSLEIPDDFSSFTSSIHHDLDSHDSTNTEDEETTIVKVVSGQETTPSDDQISFTGQCISKVEGTIFENSQQAELNNEDHMTESNEDPYRTDSHSVVMNNEEEEETIANEGDEEEVSNTEAA